MGKRGRERARGRPWRGELRRPQSWGPKASRASSWVRERPEPPGGGGAVCSTPTWQLPELLSAGDRSCLGK